MCLKIARGGAAAIFLLAGIGRAPVLADTIKATLVRAYQNNPQLNAQRDVCPDPSHRF